MSKHSAQANSQTHFSQIPTPSVPRSVFPVDYVHKTTLDAKHLVPAYWRESLPGDTYNFRIGFFARLATMKFPLMDNLFLDWQAFWCPTRLLWENWERFQGFKPTADSSTDLLIPWLVGNEATAFTPQVYNSASSTGVADYFGFPVGEPINVDGNERVSCLLHRMYRVIWNAWYRDQNYQNEVPVDLGDGPDDFLNVDLLLPRGRRQDYFWSCLPEPQRGPAIPLPIANDGLAPVFGTGMVMGFDVNDTPSSVGLATDTGNNAVRFSYGAYGDPIGTPQTLSTMASTVGIGLTRDPDFSGMVADVSLIVGTINELRTNAVLQQIFELDNRGGTRYAESLWNRFRTNAGDARLQRPEYIGGGSVKLGVNTVPQMTPTEGSNAQGNLSAYGTMAGTGSIRYTCVEHGYMMILVNLRAPLTYQQRIDRSLTRSTRFDFYEPLTAHLGEQAVLQREIYWPSDTWDKVWGYQERWGEYRYTPSQITGQFRSNAPATLDPWHLGLWFETPPELDSVTIQDDPPVDRIVAVPSIPQFIMDFGILGTETRPVPVYSTPGLNRF